MERCPVLVDCGVSREAKQGARKARLRGARAPASADLPAGVNLLPRLGCALDFHAPVSLAVGQAAPVGLATSRCSQAASRAQGPGASWGL